jgi:hypothetical protein
MTITRVIGSCSEEHVDHHNLGGSVTRLIPSPAPTAVAAPPELPIAAPPNHHFPPPSDIATSSWTGSGVLAGRSQLRHPIIPTSGGWEQYQADGSSRRMGDPNCMR